MLKTVKGSRSSLWVAAIGLVATLGAACSSDDGSGDYCVDAGDLNADGVIDGADCDLVTIGRATRALCEGTPDLWLASDACGASRATRFADNPPFMRTWSFKDRGFVSVSRDEILVALPPATPSERWTSSSLPRGLGAEAEPTAAISTSLRFFIADNRSAWFDNDNDGTPEDAEFIDLVSVFGAALVRAPSLATEGNVLVIAGRRNDLPGQLHIWKDKNNNHSLDAGEVVALDSIADAVLLNVELDQDAITYRATNNEESTWIDRNSDWVAQPEEIASTGRQNPCARYWSYYLCEDWEQRLYDMQPLTPRFLEVPARPTAVYDSLEVHYGTWLWRDTNASRTMEPWETVRIATLTNTAFGDIRFLDGERVVHVVTHQFEVVDGSGRQPLVGVTRYPAGAFLGDSCNASFPCAGELRCAEVSGAAGLRCVE